ncbi:response regulator transcription factor [Lacticaseibacillus kribbianus]|uniref:response regulator transcription factor n=1 Tax=Lacticaseibacillus kribbianus TaxID=2926292 RepID=UPI001CD37242|nr:response regulator transcription factor [Lacticaseibacillus kribbianus]
MQKILVVEDDDQFNAILTRTLGQAGYQAQGATSANAAYNLMYDQHFDLIVSDIMMPETDGYTFAATVRRTDPAIPILFITARDDIASKEKGFNVGIDDYMIKPVQLDEVKLRVRALLRRANIGRTNVLTAGNVTLDADSRVAALNGEEVALTVREFNLLTKFLTYPNHAFSRPELINEFWALDHDTSLRSVDVYITKLREKFAQADGFAIKTVHGLGYKGVLIND